MLYGFFLIIHLIVSVLLVVAILMQASKGGGLAGIAGGSGGGATQMLGGRQAATMLHKVTVGLALVFGINALLLGGLSRVGGEVRSVTLDAIAAEENYPLEFLGDSEIDPTEEQLQQAKDAVPTQAGEDGDGEAVEGDETETP
jgi:preprotein translocase subunit SecG